MDRVGLKKVFEDLGFKSIINRIPKEVEKKAEVKKTKEKDNDQLNLL